MAILCVSEQSMEEKPDLFAHAVEMGCSALCHTGWTILILLASTSVSKKITLPIQDKNTEYLTAVTSALDSLPAICTWEDLPLVTTATKELGIYEMLETGLLATLICFGHSFFKYVYCCFKLFHSLASSHCQSSSSGVQHKQLLFFLYW